jgi:integrase
VVGLFGRVLWSLIGLVGMCPVEWMNSLRVTRRPSQTKDLTQFPPLHGTHTPAVGVRLPKMEQREMLFLSSTEVVALAREIVDLYRALVYVLGFCGLRIGEAAALRRSSINLMRSELRVTESVTDVNGDLVFGATKTRQARTVAIPSAVQDQLEQHLATFTATDPDALVFASPLGEPIRLQNFRRRAWAPAVERAGLPRGLRIHDMRHTAASVLINAGVPIKSIQDHLGHSSITVTLDRYSHLYPEARKHVASVLDGLIADVENRTESNEGGPDADQTGLTRVSV